MSAFFRTTAKKNENSNASLALVGEALNPPQSRLSSEVLRELCDTVAGSKNDLFAHVFFEKDSMAVV